MNVIVAGRLTLIIPILVLLLGVPAATSSQKRSERFDPNGSFWIKGTPPTAFADFSGINLNFKGSRRLPASGVDLTNGTHLRFKTVSVRRGNFTFATTTVRGVSYTFRGRFLKGGVFASDILDDELPVLEGTLTKFKHGQKVAAEQLKFTYFGGT